MADPRTFVLIGNFEDNITPSLEKINTSLANLKKTFSGLSTRRGGGYADITKSVGSLVSSQKHLANSVKEVREEVSKSIPYLAEYRKEVGKAASANFAFARSTGQAARNEANLWRQATRDAQAYLRTVSAAAGGGRSPRFPAGRAMGGAGGRVPSMPREVVSSPYGNEYRGSVARDATYAFGQTLGYQLSNVIVGSITQGFQIGVGLMEQPFQYFANALKERMSDELSDIQAAGGLLAVARRQKDPFVKSFQESMRLTQETNARFAEIAAALPGPTQQYVEVGKRLSDTAARIVANDPAKALAEANKLRAERGVEAITATGRKAQQGAMQELLTDMTTQTVLAGLGGGGGGAGRTMGPYGLPGLTERMIGQDEVSMGQFQRYAAIFRDPAMAQALERYIPEINKTQKNSIERFQVLRKMYQEILPPEVIRAYERSLEGIKETYHTAFMNPETGLFGIGRKLKGVARNMNQFGQYIKVLEDGTEKVLTEAEIAAGDFEMVDMSVFDLFRDIIANVGVVLGPIVNNLTLLFDPMLGIANALTRAREATGKFLYSFEAYRKGLIKFAEGLSDAEKKDFAKIDLNFRASLGAINNLFNQLGVIGEAEFLDNARKIGQIDFDAAGMLKGFVDKFMDSAVANRIGNFIGTVVGVVLNQMASMVSMVAGLAKPNQLVKGFMDAFKAAKGPEAIQAIIKGVFEIIGKALIEIFKLAPAQFTLLGGVALLLPAFISGVSVAIGAFIEAVLDGQLKRLKALMRLKNAKTGIPGVIPGPGGPSPTRARPGSGGLIFDPYTPEAPAPAKPTPKGRFKNFLKGAVGSEYSIFGGKGGGLKSLFAKGGLKNLFGKGLKGLGKFGGIATAGVGIVEALMSLLSGDSLGTALGKGAGPVLGTIIGTALLGPLGGFIGGMIGSMEAVTGPLGDAASAIMGTLGTTFEFLGQIGGDLLGLINGLIGLIPGVSEGFNILEFALFALLSPFKMLEIAISGLYDLYLWIKSKTVGVNEEERERMESRHTQMLTDQLTILGRLRSGYSLEEQKRAEYAKFLEAKERGDVQAMNRTAEYMRSIEVMLKERGPKDKEGDKDKPPAPTTPTPATKPTIPTKPGDINAAITTLGGDPSATLNVPKLTTIKPKPKSTLSPMNQAVADFFGGAWKLLTTKPSQTGARPDPYGFTAPKGPAEKTPEDISEINKKATEQAKGITQVHKGTEKTTTAVKELTAKITAQTSVQTTVAAIYNLLASGSLRVNGVMAGMPGGGADPGLNTDVSTYDPQDPAKWFLRNGWEQSQVDVKTSNMVSGNSGAVVSGDMTVNAPITINGVDKDADEIATLVAYKLGEAVADARSASIFV